ncbi:hypothetical protein BS47DRAFT_1293053 [Hydnum rufescens UP504]|uniref:Bms1-type G domain-containing protein n=1 Tax=Hydnum rufescens UP504 TaxID=1448309 RepID=A0A9P6B1P7_9AGAM|nr:hypothetical protein BS47DRAFT_1293053 [Hydnum rufescens UP504]
MGHSHRPTLKQQNKPFKSKHATKSALKEASKGRVARASVKAGGSPTVAQTRLNRRNATKQMELKKRHELVEATRIFNGVHGAPRIVAIVPLCPDASVLEAAKCMVAPLGVDVADMPSYGTWKFPVERFKTSAQFILLPYRELYAALDACKVADYVVFVLSTEVEVDTWGDLALRCLQAQGLPEVITVTQVRDTIRSIISIQPIFASCGKSPAGQELKQRSAIIKSLLSFIQYFVPTQQRVYDLSSPAEAINAARCFCEGRPNRVRWREGRPWVLVDSLGWEKMTRLGTLRVSGIIRGSPLSADRLIHVPNFGDYEIEKIVSSPTSHRARREQGLGSMDVEPQVLSERTNDGDSLVSCLEPDTLLNEQTWPTDEEMLGISGPSNGPALPPAKNGTTPKAVRKVPKGTSAYQAAWIVESDDEDEVDDTDGSESEGDERYVDAEEGYDAYPEPVEMVDEEEETDTRKGSVAFADLDLEEEGRQLDDWRAARAREREDRDDLEFPDELDTPKDVPARTRFQRYRGLRSFRTSPWDPYENLPVDYARIFQFEDYERTKRKVRKQAEEGVASGTPVSIYLKNVPQNVALSYNAAYPLVVFGLLQHEHKYSVLNFAVQRNTEYSESVRSKDPLILCVGPRRYHTNPVYSDHQRGGAKAANNVHKFERYLRHGVTSVATVFGPIIFGKQPCLLLRSTDDPQAPDLVATGSFMNPDPKRIIAKRIILTGHPFKVNKKTATIRYMFFNPEDVAYFAPVQLHTKHGRVGHIRESLGTHGYFKAHFDGQINQMDTVCLSLYKRVFPKWSQLWKESGRSLLAPREDVMEE